MLAPELLSQSSGSDDCNETTRRLDQPAGYTGESNDTCTVITFSVAGQELHTKDKCWRGGAHYNTSLYRCEGTLVGWKCDPKGNEVLVRTWEGGSCPTLPDISELGELSWDTFKKVPDLLAKALKCVPPKEDSSKDPSAKVEECEDGEEPETISGEVRLGGSGHFHTMWNGNPSGLLGNGLPWWNPFLSPYDSAQTADPYSLQGIMRSVAIHHDVPPGFSLSADVTISHIPAAATDPDHVSVANLVGRLSANGQFDLVQTQPAVGDGGVPATVTQRVTFDGSLVQQLVSGSEAGNVIQSTYPSDLLRLAYLTYIEPVYWWATDPLTLPLFDGIVFAENPGALPDLVEVTREHPGQSGSFPGTRWVVSTAEAVPHPYLFQILDPAGAVWHDATYESYVVRGGFWRPRVIKSTSYLDGTPDGRRVVTEVQILSGEVLSVAEAAQIPGQWDEDILWQVWE